jgi:hypothetical protein
MCNLIFKILILLAGLAVMGAEAGESNTISTNASVKNSRHGLRLMLHTGQGAGKFGGVKGLHGLLYMARNWETPKIDRTNRVDILSTDDKTRIVVMVGDNGPLYNSTNSGLTWTVTSAPGTYDFPLTIGADGGGFSASATLNQPVEKLLPVSSPTNGWYAVGKTANDGELVITSQPSQPAPVLSITRTVKGVVVAWPAQYPTYVLQKNGDLGTTNWTDVTNPVIKSGNENQVIIPPAAEGNFYRLRSP